MSENTEQVCFDVDTFTAFVAVTGPLLDIQEKAIDAIKTFETIKVDLPDEVWMSHIDLAMAVAKAQVSLQAVPYELRKQVASVLQDFKARYVIDRKGESNAT